MAISTVKLNGETLLTVNDTTATISDVESGKTFTLSNGTKGTGTSEHPPKTAGIYYTTCTTAGETQQKDITISDITSLDAGLQIRVRFSNQQAYNGTPTLKLNSFAAKEIRRDVNNAAGQYEWRGTEILDLVYDGTYWLIVDGGTASVTYYGVTKLSNAVDSTSEVMAASLKAVKTAYDLANGKANPSDIPNAYTSNPVMDGTASAGSSGAWAKGDHVHPSDTSKVNQTQLSTVETGTTASQAYAIGNYFIWNNLLYQATTAISSGDTFTVGTNCTQVTVGEELNKKAPVGSGIYYAICDTSSSSATKVVTIPELTSVVEGTRVAILFRNANLTTYPLYLTVNSTTKPIAKNGTDTFSSGTSRYRAWSDNQLVTFVFCSDGNIHPSYYWVMEQATYASTTEYGVTLLSDSTSSANVQTAATPYAIRKVETQIAPIETNASSTTNAYNVGDYFLYSGSLYRCTNPISAEGEITIGTNCEEVTLTGQLNTKPGYELLAPLETSSTASRAYTYSERFVYNGVLYQAIAPIASGGAITPGTNCQDATNLESRFKTYSYTANGTYTVTLARNSRRYLVIADRLGRAAALVNYIAYNGNTPSMVTIADIDSANRGISLSISGATLTITVSATYAVIKIIEV